eukprot:6191076-Pleurochrysis_carterae.AAC.1
MESKLSQTPSIEAHETLKADLLCAEKRSRALERQREDASAKAARVVASLKKERDKAAAEVVKKKKECAQVEKKLEATSQLASEAVHRSESIRSGAAALAAEKRAAEAEGHVAEL